MAAYRDFDPNSLALPEDNKSGGVSDAMVFAAPAALAAAATALRKQGLTPAQIKAKLGSNIFMGNDGVWSVEKMSPTPTRIGPQIGVPVNGTYEGAPMGTLADHVHQPHVYANAPGVGKTPLMGGSVNSGTMGWMIPRGGKNPNGLMWLNDLGSGGKQASDIDRLEIAQHETQHLIDDRYGRLGADTASPTFGPHSEAQLNAYPIVRQQRDYQLQRFRQANGIPEGAPLNPDQAAAFNNINEYRLYANQTHEINAVTSAARERKYEDIRHAQGQQAADEWLKANPFEDNEINQAGERVPREYQINTIAGRANARAGTPVNGTGTTTPKPADGWLGKWLGWKGGDKAADRMEARTPVPGSPRDLGNYAEELKGLPGASMLPNENGADVQMGAFPITDKTGKVVGAFPFDINRDTITPNYPEIDPAYRGQGLGQEAYRKIIDFTHGTGRDIVSDSSNTPDSQRVYDALERQGVPVERNPFSRISRGSGYLNAPEGFNGNYVIPAPNSDFDTVNWRGMDPSAAPRSRLTESQQSMYDGLPRRYQMAFDDYVNRGFSPTDALATANSSYTNSTRLRTGASGGDRRMSMAPPDDGLGIPDYLRRGPGNTVPTGPVTAPPEAPPQGPVTAPPGPQAPEAPKVAPAPETTPAPVTRPPDGVSWESLGLPRNVPQERPAGPPSVFEGGPMTAPPAAAPPVAPQNVTGPPEAPAAPKPLTAPEGGWYTGPTFTDKDVSGPRFLSQFDGIKAPEVAPTIASRLGSLGWQGAKASILNPEALGFAGLSILDNTGVPGVDNRSGTGLLDQYLRPDDANIKATTLPPDQAVPGSVPVSLTDDEAARKKADEEARKKLDEPRKVKTETIPGDQDVANQPSPYDYMTMANTPDAGTANPWATVAPVMPVTPIQGSTTPPPVHRPVTPPPAAPPPQAVPSPLTGSTPNAVTAPPGGVPAGGQQAPLGNAGQNPWFQASMMNPNKTGLLPSLLSLPSNVINSLFGTNLPTMTQPVTAPPGSTGGPNAVQRMLAQVGSNGYQDQGGYTMPYDPNASPYGD